MYVVPIFIYLYEIYNQIGGWTLYSINECLIWGYRGRIYTVCVCAVNDDDDDGDDAVPPIYSNKLEVSSKDPPLKRILNI